MDLTNREIDLQWLPGLIILILGVLFFPFITGMVLLILSFFLKGKKSYLFLVLSCLLTSLIFLDMVPGYGADADRYAQITLQMSSISNFSGFFHFIQNNSQTQYQSSSYLFFFLQYLVSKSNCFNLLSYISTFLGSFFIFYPFLNYSKERFQNNSVKFVSLILAFSTLNVIGYSTLASTMRWGLAATSCFFVDYIYFFKLNKNIKYIWLLFIPIFFHPGIIVAVLISAYMGIIKKLNFVLFIIPLIILVVYFSTLGSVSINNDGNFLGSINSMANIYSTDFMNNGSSNLSQIRNFTNYFLFFMSSIYVLFKMYYRGIKNSFDSIVLFMIFISLILLPRTLIWGRYFTFTMPIMCFYTLKLNTNLSKIVLTLIYILSIVVAIGSYRQFVFPVSNIDILFENIFSILSSIPRVL